MRGRARLLPLLFFAQVVSRPAPADDVAVAYVAMGAGAREAILAYSVHNLRTRGKFNGPVYIVTDQPRCAPASTIVITVPPSRAPVEPRTGRPIPSLVPVPPDDFTRSITKLSYYKSQKMRLLQLLPNDVTYVLYLDIDVVPALPIARLLAERHRLDPSRASLLELPASRPPLAAKQRSLTHTAPGSRGPQHVEARQSSAPSILLFAERRYRGARVSSPERSVDGQPFHTGAFILRRNASERCLASWGNHTLTNALALPTKHVRDQIAFGLAMRDGGCVPGELSVLYLRTVVLTRQADLRVLQHVTRTNLVVKRDLSEDVWCAPSRLPRGTIACQGPRGCLVCGWRPLALSAADLATPHPRCRYTFGELLVGVDANAARAAVPQPTLWQRLAQRVGLAARQREEPAGFRWWTARNPQCVRAPAGSIQDLAVEAKWLPSSRSRGNVLQRFIALLH